MSDSRQLSIDFDDWDFQERPVTPASADVRAASMRAAVSDPSREPLVYISFGSGSSGNSCYIGTKAGGVIVDAGVNSDQIEAALKVNGIPMSHVKGLCLTHDHTDHVKFAYKLLRANKHLRLFCTNRVLNAILRRHSISKRIKDYHVPIFKEFPFMLAGFEVTAFDVPHDAADNAGFCFRYADKTFVMATDLGEVSERARFYMSQADFLMIEANYDLHMLQWGPYPEYLKARIRTDHGHLDNTDTATFVASIAGGAEPVNPRLRYIFLCHLSQDNNTPEKAVGAVRSALEEAGLTVGDASDPLEASACRLQLMALPRFAPTRLFHLR